MSTPKQVEAIEADIRAVDNAKNAIESLPTAQKDWRLSGYLDSVQMDLGSLARGLHRKLDEAKRNIDEVSA